MSKRVSLDARTSAISAAIAVDAPEVQQEVPEEEGVNLTLRLPVSAFTTLQAMSTTLKAKRVTTPGRKLKKQGASDPLSVNGLIRQAVKEFLERDQAKS